MSSHHDHDNHPQEAKPVAFRTPLILALVTLLVILLAVSTCDKKHGCCEDPEKCAAPPESKDGEHGMEHGHAAEAAPAAQDHTAVADTTNHPIVDTTAVKPEEHAHH